MQDRNRDEDSRADAAQCRPRGRSADEVGSRTVMIHRCPKCDRLGRLADAVATKLRGEAGTTVEVVDGQEGEFRVDVDDYNVYSRADSDVPTADEVVAAVHDGATPGVGG